MATFLEIGLFENISVIFAIILVFAVVYGGLQLTNTLGGNKVIHTLIAAIIALLVLLAPNVSKLINYMAPWFAFIFVLFLFLLLGFNMFGGGKGFNLFTQSRTINWIFLGIGMFILVVSLFRVYGPYQQQYAPDQAGKSYSQSVASVFFSPQILGFILIMAIAFFTMALITGSLKNL